METQTALVILNILNNEWWTRRLILLHSQKRAVQNKKNRTKHVCPPRIGRRPFPVIIKERQDRGLETDHISIFKYTCSGKSRSKDKETADSSHDLDDHSNGNDHNSEDSHDDPRMQIIEQMDEKLTELTEELEIIYLQLALLILFVMRLHRIDGYDKCIIFC